MRSAERRKVNVLEMKCLRSLVGVSRMDRDYEKGNRKGRKYSRHEKKEVQTA